MVKAAKSHLGIFPQTVIVSTMDDIRILLSICVGIGLAAACGFRVFVPLLCLSIASMTGYVHVDDSFAWVGTWPALIAFAVATVVEVAAYYVPYIDNLLDSIAVPAATAAGVCVAALAITDVDPFWRWTVAIIGGGGVAASTQIATTKLRAASSTITAGFGNPVLATVEVFTSSVLSVISVVWPIVAIVLVIALLAVSWVVIYFVGKHVIRLFRRKAPAA